MTHSVAQESFSSNKAPLFDGSNYVIWSVRMEAYLISLGFDVWKVVFDVYKFYNNSPIDRVGKKACESNAKVRNAILYGLSNSKFVKIVHCMIAKEV